ncbi:MAG: DUF378 domain-containing protein [Candidatus Gastranaerophilales bacterium]|nr:DUF378 domain-containing protein [Candidatus Gastranaerophilales bacterium]
MNILKWIVYSLVLTGALNWGLIGIFGFDLVAFLFGEMTALTRIVYALVGLSAVIYFILSFRDNTECTSCNC